MQEIGGEQSVGNFSNYWCLLKHTSYPPRQPTHESLVPEHRIGLVESEAFETLRLFRGTCAEAVFRSETRGNGFNGIRHSNINTIVSDVESCTVLPRQTSPENVGQSNFDAVPHIEVENVA
jgi:hypothetical protein